MEQPEHSLSDICLRHSGITHFHRDTRHHEHQYQPGCDALFRGTNLMVFHHRGNAQYELCHFNLEPEVYLCSIPRTVECLFF